MHRSLFAVSVFALGLLATSPAFAFSQEPINGVSGGTGGGNRFIDPDAVDRLNSPAPGDDSKSGQDSPFSFSVTGPGSSGSSPSVRAQGNDNSHLYWGNTTNRFETYGRNSTSNRSPYGYPYR